MNKENMDYLDSFCDCNMLPSLGSDFPHFKIHATSGPMNFPDDFKGKWVVLFSHPADFTPVCTTEFVSFAKHQKEFDELNTQLVGLSIDQVFSHIKWKEWIKENLKVEIKFPIIADNGDMAERLGMVHAAKGVNTVRAVFIIDPKGILRLMLYYPQEVGRNIEEILRILKAFQVSHQEKAAMPANWPNNELIGDNVIIPPATNEEEARKRKGKDGCYDWWFCYKEIAKKK